MQATIPNPCKKSHLQVSHPCAVTHFKGCALKDDISVAYKLCPAAFFMPLSFGQSTILTIIRILSYDDNGDDDDSNQVMMPKMMTVMMTMTMLHLEKSPSPRWRLFAEFLYVRARGLSLHHRHHRRHRQRRHHHHQHQIIIIIVIIVSS